MFLLLLLLLSPVSSNMYSSPRDTCEAAGGEGCGCSTLSRDTTQSTRDPPPEESVHTADSISPGLDGIVLVEAGMVLVEAGDFTMGTDNPILPLDGEGPARRVHLSTFHIDKYEVTNTQFAQFIKQTNHNTDAEAFGDSFVLDGLLSPEEDAKVLTSVADATWWLPVEGAAWDHPEGRDTDVTSRGDHPVVHVSWNDASAYCRWAGKRLPTEAEFEKSCQGGRDTLYPWGNELLVGAKHQTNIWQGTFPKQNTEEDGYKTTSPIGTYPPNGYGIHDLIGNVWEWVDDWWTTDTVTSYQHDPQGPSSGTEKVKKGGSFMCTKQYCYRYRCPARTKTSADTTGLNVGFRCARSAVGGV